MRRLRRWIRDFFGFSKTQVNQFLILLPLTLLLLFSLSIYRGLFLAAPVEDGAANAALDRLAAELQAQPTRSTAHAKYDRPSLPVAWRLFDPNAATLEELIALGLSSRLATRIANYRAKGGRFWRSADLMKIYGMDSAWYAQAQAYIRIAGARKQKPSYAQAPGKQSSPPRDAAPAFDLNKADTARLRSLYGIGPILARRIVRYREELGGFIDKRQLLEVYGLPPEVAAELSDRSFIARDFIPERLSVNATAATLGRHPYIGRKRASIIAAYRFQHGAFRAPQDWLAIVSIDSVFLQRIVPYLEPAP